MFKIGDKVRFLDEELEGIVLKVLSMNKLLIEDEHGFENEISAMKIFKINSSDDSSLNNSNVSIKDNYLFDKKKSPNKNLSSFIEIDLHIHELRPDYSNLTNYEMLQIQIQALKRKIKEANTKKISRLVIIHGVGKGVLRSEVHIELQKHENIEFLDASYLDYGQGATQVVFKWFNDY